MAKRARLTVNDFDPDEFDDKWGAPCGICGDPEDHEGQPHGEATGDGLSRYDILGYLDGRPFLS